MISGDDRRRRSVVPQSIASALSPVDEVLALFAPPGDGVSVGEPLSQTEHALQIAWLAEQAGADQALVAAALLHDIGHLLEAGLPSSPSGNQGHDVTGAEFLAPRFSLAVVEPVRLHVRAKRYLCTAEPDFFAQLAPVSRHSLEAQGGPMTPAEAEAFLETPYAAEAVALRRWDEMARVPGLATPSLAHFRPCLEAVARAV
jgi:phosphonate degradation associated HDIG domain protein